MNQTIAMQQVVAVEVLGRKAVSVPGKIEKVEDGHLHISVAHLIDVESRVRVLLPNETSVMGPVTYRNPGSGPFLIGVRVEPAADLDRSRGPRSPYSGSVVVTILEQRNDASISAELLDKSTDGLDLAMMSRVPHGAWVKVELPDSFLYGEIRHCIPSEDGSYRVGFAIDTVVKRGRC